MLQVGLKSQVRHFIKSTWDFNGGKTIGMVNGKNLISEGDVNCYVVPPYDISENPFTSMEGQQWIIHKKAYPRTR